MSDKKEPRSFSTDVPTFFASAGKVSAGEFSVHVVTGIELPDGNVAPSFILTMGTEFAEELGKQILAAVEESRRARDTEERPKLVAEV